MAVSFKEFKSGNFTNCALVASEAGKKSPDKTLLGVSHAALLVYAGSSYELIQRSGNRLPEKFMTQLKAANPDPTFQTAAESVGMVDASACATLLFRVIEPDLRFLDLARDNQ